MLCLSGFELYSRWVPLSDGRRQGKCTKEGDAIVLFCLFKPFPFLVGLSLARMGSVCTGPSEGEGQGRGSPGE